MGEKLQAVSVIGLGEMGAALARALQNDGYQLTVWNRTSAKAAPLIAQGARFSETVVEAVSASEIVLVCVSDFDTVCELIHSSDVSKALTGRTLVQLTTRTPKEARSAEGWAKAAGIKVLEGAIQGYPMHIGTEEGSILYSGSRNAFDENISLLKTLAGRTRYIGEGVGSSAALDLALAGSVVPGAVLAFLQGAALCNAEGVALETYLNLVEGDLYPGLILASLRLSAEKIERGDHAYTGEGAPIDAWIPGIEMVARANRDAGINPGWTEMTLQYLRQATAAGHGQSELSAVYEIFRQK